MTTKVPETLDEIVIKYGNSSLLNVGGMHTTGKRYWEMTKEELRACVVILHIMHQEAARVAETATAELTRINNLIQQAAVLAEGSVDSVKPPDVH